MPTVGQRVRTAQALILCLCVALAALVGRLAYIQTQMRPDLVEWSERRQSSTIPLPGRRGTIFDRRHRVLAGSLDQPTIYADPRIVGDHAEAATKLSDLLKVPAGEIKKLLDKPTSPAYVILKRGAERAEVEGLDSLGLRGVNVHREPSRTYPMGPVGAHVIGFVGAEQSGLEGIELGYERYLRASPGKRTVFWDAHRRAMFQAPDSYQPPRDGLHLVLTIDAAVQEVVERELEKTVTHFKAESGLAVMMDPGTGEVLALSCCPMYSPSEGGKAAPEVRRNRVLTDPVEPGSIFKPFVMSAALAAGVTTPTESIYCHGGLYVCGKRMLHDHHPYGNLTASEVVGHSSNIGMAIIGQRLGNRKMYTAMRDFGFGQATGIDLPGEDVGLLMPYKAWNSYTTTSVPMGHEIAITPIQAITAFCALINGGRLLQPRVVSAVVNPQGEVVEDRSAAKERAVILDPETAAKIKDILIAVVTGGTGKPSALGQWTMMAKTGTAQVPRKDRRGYEPDAYLGSFIAAAPATEPRVACLLMVRKPKRSIGYYGSQVAAPAVKAILEQVLPYLNVPPDKILTKTDSRLVTSARD